MPTNGCSIKPLKVKLLAGEQKATEERDSKPWRLETAPNVPIACRANKPRRRQFLASASPNSTAAGAPEKSSGESVAFVRWLPPVPCFARAEAHDVDPFGDSFRLGERERE